MPCEGVITHNVATGSPVPRRGGNSLTPFWLHALRTANVTITRHAGGILDPMHLPFGAGTAIPERFGPERDRVLRILARWEASTRAAATWLQTPPPRESSMAGPAGSR